jgi:hypothetical protein
VVSNGSGSHHSLRKLNQRLDLISTATAKAGGVYLYANQRGCATQPPRAPFLLWFWGLFRVESAHTRPFRDAVRFPSPGV